MKKKNLSLQILALCVAAGSMPVLASKCTVTIKVKEKFNAVKSQLQNLISKLSDEEQQELNEWLVNQEKEFKGDNSQGDNEIIKNIEEKINVLTKKINEQKKQNLPSKDENKELNVAIEQLKKSKQELQNLIDFSAGQGIENSKAKEILDSTNIEENSSISEVKEKTNKINKAKQDLQNLIEDTKNKAKNEFDIKKQELKTLIESEKARNIDKSEEQNVLNTTNVAESSNISEIKSKTKNIEEAINSLTKKINEQENKQEFEQAKQDFEKIKRELQELIATPDAKEVENIDDINKTLNEANIAKDWTISKIQDASNNLKNVKEQLENKINTTKHQVKQNFEAKKQELETLIDSAKAKNVDNSEAKKVLNATNVTESSNISDIKSKTKNIEDAINSLTKKIDEAKSHEVVPPSDEFLKIEEEFQDQKKQIESKLDEICSLKFNKTYSEQLIKSNESIKKRISQRVNEVYGDHPGYEKKYYYRRAYNERNKEDCKKYINQLKNIYKIVDMYANYLKEVFKYIESEDAKLSDEIKQKIMDEDVLNDHQTELSRSNIENLNWDYYVRNEDNVKFITEKKKVFDKSLAKVKKAIFDKMIDDMFEKTSETSVYKIKTFLPSETDRDERKLYFDKSLPLFKLFSKVSVNFNTFLGGAKTKGIYEQDGKLRFEGFIQFYDPEIPYYKYIGLKKPITIDEITIKAQ
ncbi:ABC transporter ATP-binding protein [Metamycoplasma hominis]|uniref:ABC transporter ATP-binding protein n=1 Tax=Metamycoplasma hominis TaxID=2098 RepID=UPI0019397BE8|nr:ABC transporter ATP-binding protein [Metamycoplasma hominis]